jgi:orotate phosphoribosyltransferase
MEAQDQRSRYRRSYLGQAGSQCIPCYLERPINERKILISKARATLKYRVALYSGFVGSQKPEQWFCLAGLGGSKLPAFAAKVMSRKYVNRVNLSHTSSRFSGPYMEAMAEASATVTPIDTIVCLDGCEVIGAYMAEELTGLGVVSNNRHHTFYVVSPEFDREGQMVVRDNIRHMFKDKNVLIILATAMSGHTIYKSIKCINSYGGKVQGISCVFGAVEEIEGYPVNAVFTRDDLPDFELSEPDKCPMCEAGKPLDAVICSYGYSKL